MNENQLNPFQQWKLLSMDELKKLDIPGAKIEIAVRTQQPQDAEAALLSLDNSTFNAIFALSLAKDSNSLQTMLHNLDAHLVPLLTSCRNLCVEENEDIYRYAVDALYGNTAGTLRVWAEALHKLQEKVIKPNSRIVNELFTLRFTLKDILYLNYVWTKDLASAQTSVKQFSKLIEEYFRKEDSFTEAEKKFISKELSREFPYHYEGYSTFGEYVSAYARCTVMNDENWEFARELTQQGLLTKNNMLITAIPFISSDADRFEKLTLEEKFYSLDNSLEGIKSREALDKLLAKFNCAEYLNDDSRAISLDCLMQRLRLGLVDIHSLSVPALKQVITVKFDSEIINHLIQEKPENLLDILGITLSQYYCSFYNAKIFSESITKELQVKFISSLIQAVYDNEKENAFIHFIEKLLQCEELLKFYEREILLEISKKLCEFAEIIDYGTEDTLMEMYMLDEEYSQYLVGKEKQKEIERLEREERQRQNFIQKVTNELCDISDVKGLEFYYRKKYTDSVTEEVFHKMVYEKVQQLFVVENVMYPEYVKLYSSLYTHKIINYSELFSVMQKLNGLEEVAEC